MLSKLARIPSLGVTRVRFLSSQALDKSGKSFRPVVGIKRETVNLWEQRSPLIPSHVKKLVHQGIPVLVQPSNRRCFAATEFEEAGAVMSEDLSAATLILGVKRPSQLRPDDLLPEKTYCFFTHTIKAQSDNMPLLDELLSRKIRMIDYECMVNAKNKRLVAFGKYAGMAGTIDILHGLGIRLLAMGHRTPFLRIGMAHSFQDSQQAQQAIRLAGYEIALGRMPDSLGPLTFVINGDGNVSQGAQIMLDCLPVEYVEASQLKEVAEHGKRNRIYVSVVTVAEYMVHKQRKDFNAVEYFADPSLYESNFRDTIAPYTSVLINGTYWDARVPQILTCKNVKSLLDVRPNIPGSPNNEGCPTLPHRLLAICDISADPGGSVEFTEECTTIDEPFNLYNPRTGKTEYQIHGDGILMCSIDNMPAQLPYEASEYFGDTLLPYLPDMIKSNALEPFENYDASPEVKNVISNVESELTALREHFPRIQPRHLNIFEDERHFEELVRQNDLIVSLIPWKYHPLVVKQCIKQAKNLLTASYCTPVLKEMEDEINKAGITAFMEIGLDPGIDHLLTKECVDYVKEHNGRVISYRSFTGGLPAPENSNNPLRYKFSWSPEAAMSTVMNGAKYLEDGQIKEIPADGSLMKMARPMNVFPGFNLEGYPNRDSTRYIQLYGLEGCQTVLRGTMRYGGYTEAVSVLLNLGLLDSDSKPYLQPGAKTVTWLGVPAKLHGKELEDALLKKLSGDRKKYECLLGLGLLSEDPVALTNTPLSSTSAQLSKLLNYGPNERDLIVMAHELIIDWPDKKLREKRDVSLVAYGEAGQGKSGLAMSRTVGIPAAIAAKMILDGEITDKGIVLPLQRYIYKPILERLKTEGIEAQEMSTFVELP
ncbi:unnamed protein product [Echinostoma caproni]|uniref:Saccharopine dehydrogenase n=1 Tax=Echinostoma caproni TaxID=27848 RepID=A0A183AAG3_9TREM|nr:unnamed protein product [Echinostoma caproni]